MCDREHTILKQYFTWAEHFHSMPPLGISDLSTANIWVPVRTTTYTLFENSLKIILLTHATDLYSGSHVSISSLIMPVAIIDIESWL